MIKNEQKNEKLTPGGPSVSSGSIQSSIRRYIIIGERRPSHYWWAILLLLGSCGFLFTGVSSYYADAALTASGSVGAGLELTNENSLLGEIISGNEGSPISSSMNTLENQISFFPQGLLMCFYGCLGFFLSFYWWFLIFWNVGGGFNEFNKKEGKLRIFRWGYPGKNRRIDLSYSLKDVEAIKVELKQGGFVDPQRTIYLKLKGKRDIPVSGIGEPLTLKEIEKQASELANFLQVSLEGL